MAHFEHDFVDLRLPKDGEIRTLISQLTFKSDIVDNFITAPIGMLTDLGSVPTILQNVYPKDGKAVLAYIIHDYLYQSGTYTRDESDKVLKEAMGVLGVSFWRRWSVYYGLKAGGWVAWNEHRKNDEA